MDAAAVQYCRMYLEDPSAWAIGLTFSLVFLVIALLWDDPFPRWLCGVACGIFLLLTIVDWDLRRDARKIVSASRDS